jgi:inorganic pyrophosphatase
MHFTLQEMVAPAMLALCTPVAIGFTFRLVGSYTGNRMEGVEVVSAFLIFASLTGLLMAIFFDNAVSTHFCYTLPH